MKIPALMAALACAALLPAHAMAAPAKAVIVHLRPVALPATSSSAPDAAREIERNGRLAQAPILAQLAELRREGHVRHVRSLWIAGAVALTADESALATLGARPDVRWIEADSELPIHPADAVTGEPGIASTGAPAFWAQGVDGRGITVAALDTGVDLTHAELAGRYRAGADSWFDPYGEHAAPADVDGHGTEVMGVIVAGAGIGMAPGARFIAARAFNDAGMSTASGIHAAFQWLLDPDRNPATSDAPNVVNISWGAQEAACVLEFQPDLRALRAAGILPVVAAGNAGAAFNPFPPDNSPANLPEAFAVGATQSPTTIAPFSSRGPSSCGGGQFPALVAPGTGIRTTGRLGVDAAGLAGTSFSAPHVAGALALLLQVAPQLTADQQANLLTQSAVDLGAPGPDSTYGAGFLDVVAAARMLHSPALDFDPPTLSGATYTDAALQVRADDVLSAIAAGEWWLDVDPGIGAAQPLAAADGSFDSHSEALVAQTPPLEPGAHVLGMRTRDAAGNWSTAATLAITIPAPPAPPIAVPVVPDVPVAPAAPAATAQPLSLESRFRRVAVEGFEHGLGAWSRRVGLVAAPPEAAMSGTRGMRATLVAGAPAFVERRLPHAGDAARLTLSLDPRALSSAGAWIEVAVITGARGRLLASVDVRSLAGGDQMRLSASAPAGVLHSQAQRLSRGPVALTLTLDPVRAHLLVDGADAAQLARAASAPRPEAVVLGAWRKAPRRASGYVDFDRVILREAP